MMLPQGLDPETRNQAIESLHLALSHRGEGPLRWLALGLALLLHAGVLFVHLPELARAPAPQKDSNLIVVRRYIPPPPRIERRTPPTSKKLTRKIPIPDPTPADPEPIREPEPEPPPPVYPDDAEFVLGVPTPPGPTGPAEPILAGVGGCTNPVRIEESYVQPQYPELARVARVEGTVILQAVIHVDGTVGDCEILRVSQPGFAFEDAAIAAVQQWRYEPATQDGRPVTVYFTVLVDFTLL